MIARPWKAKETVGPRNFFLPVIFDLKSQGLKMILFLFLLMIHIAR
jgi:hypothetical protein